MESLHPKFVAPFNKFSCCLILVIRREFIYVQKLPEPPKREVSFGQLHDIFDVRCDGVSSSHLGQHGILIMYILARLSQQCLYKVICICIVDAELYD